MHTTSTTRGGRENIVYTPLSSGKLTGLHSDDNSARGEAGHSVLQCWVNGTPRWLPASLVRPSPRQPFLALARNGPRSKEVLPSTGLPPGIGIGMLFKTTGRQG